MSKRRRKPCSHRGAVRVNATQRRCGRCGEFLGRRDRLDDVPCRLGGAVTSLRQLFNYVLLLAIGISAGGCSISVDPRGSNKAAWHWSAGELRPVVDLPRELRQRNWGGGSCVHASTVNLLRWQEQYELADWWRQSYSGGEYSSRLNGRLDDAGLRYAFTVDGDVAFLEWCVRTRRGAGIGYYPNHAINLVHLDDQRAGLLDNNRPERIIWVDRNTFLRNWKQRYGGWAWTLVYTPRPPTPWYEVLP